MIRQIFFYVIVPAVFGYTLGGLLAGCGTLTPADEASIAADGVRISVCQEKTRECKAEAGDAAALKCWPVYDDCMVHAGLRDAGGQ